MFTFETESYCNSQVDKIDEEELKVLTILEEWREWDRSLLGLSTKSLLPSIESLSFLFYSSPPTLPLIHTTILYPPTLTTEIISLSVFSLLTLW